MRRLNVDLGDRSYPILIGHGIIGQLPGFLAERGIRTVNRLLVVTDDQVAKHHLQPVLDVLQAAGYMACSHIIPAGEQSKSLAQLENIITTALEAGLDRRSVIIALGGGVVGDLAGFAAACYMRGIRFVQMPTTVLAHDSSVGGKTGVNHPLAKNIIGAFHQPELVCYDTATLATLSERDIRAGLSEVIKHGLIWDASFVNWCEEHAEELLALEPEAIAHALYVGCHVKAQVVSQDERESGLRAILNLGHTIGHALEAVAGYNELQHGEAISIGMVGAARLAVRLGYDQEIHTVTKRVLRKFGLPIRLPAHYDREQIMNAMMHDKKFKDGKMVFVVPVAIGQVEIRNDIEADWIRAIIDELKQEA
jgi:3-dehydroquinate synthase